MCVNCYSRWRRANPGIRVSLMNMDLIEESLPARFSQIMDRTGLSEDAVRRNLRKLNKEKRAHIGRWDPPHVTGSRFMPVWVAGKGANRRGPNKQERRDYENSSRRKRMARRDGRHQPAPAACWTAALGG
jgi:hypothetical protein